MTLQGMFPGGISINGALEVAPIGVHVDDGCAIFHDGPSPSLSLCRRQLTVRPFDRHMLFTQAPARMSEGFFYEIAGTEVGQWTEGPLGHPGDGEFNTWPVRAFRLDVSYFSDRMTAVLTGRTASGTSPFDNSQQLDPWDFSVRFEIPREDFQRVFDLNDATHAQVLRLFELHGRGAGRALER